MRILAIDTSTDVCSVAFFNNGEISSQLKYSSKKHAKILLSMILNLLSKSEISLNQLDALAYNCGPGSFTGLRIGISIVQGIGLGKNLPLIGISSLAVVAETAWYLTKIKRVLVALNAYRRKIYWAKYQRSNLFNSIWKGVETETILKPLNVKSEISSLNGMWCVAGNGWDIYPELMDIKKLYVSTSISIIPIAYNILPLAIIKYKKGNICSADCSLVELHYDYLSSSGWKKSFP
ncbi:MAG: tRNA (adenosine(37)-N6)-threonylcarbamoyltransferase complex dimerization subunit type 1 TsaB [Candidatus Dasytiphilus stammeri]